MLPTLALRPVLSPESRAHVSVVALQGLERVVGQARFDQLRGRPEQAVADPDVVVEEGERLPGLEGLEPEAHAAELGGHGVDVHAVQAPADDVAQGVLVKERRRLALARRVCANSGEMPGEAMCRADEEMARTDGGIRRP